MNLYIGLTDKTWFDNLRAQKDIDEVNFWQPGGRTHFRAIPTGALFLFKLHNPYNHIVGGGVFFYSNIMPVSLAWQAFQEKNGAQSLFEMRKLIEQYRKQASSNKDYNIGCIILTQPFFWDQDKWLTVPVDWKPNIVQGKKYDISTSIGKKLWDDVQMRLQARPNIFASDNNRREDQKKYGEPVLVRPRLGQGAFRVFVMDAYSRKCAVTQEKVLPALQASHIKPYAESGPHDIGNGILLRSDLHGLLDAGYMTITKDYHCEISRRIKEDFDNGEEYNKLHGKLLHLPAKPDLRPDPEYIKWHNEKKFLG